MHVCMYVCVYVCTDEVCTYVCAYVCIIARTQVQSMYVNMCVRVYTCMTWHIYLYVTHMDMPEMDGCGDGEKQYTSTINIST